MEGKDILDKSNEQRCTKGNLRKKIMYNRKNLPDDQSNKIKWNIR